MHKLLFLHFVESITHGLASKETGAQYCMLAHDRAAAEVRRVAPAQLEEDRAEQSVFPANPITGEQYAHAQGRGGVSLSPGAQRVLQKFSAPAQLVAGRRRSIDYLFV